MTCRVECFGKKISFLHNSEFFSLLFFQILLFYIFFFLFIGSGLKRLIFFVWPGLERLIFFPSFSNKNNKINISRTTLSKKILICNENILGYGAYVWPPVFQSICIFECKFSQNIESFSFFFSNKEYDASFLFKKFLL